MEVCRPKKQKMEINLETELCLGLPGGGGGGGGGDTTTPRKRGYYEKVDLKLNLLLSNNNNNDKECSQTKHISMEEIKNFSSSSSSPKETKNLLSHEDLSKPSAPKGQVVGWPPVRSYRKNVLTSSSIQKNNIQDEDDDLEMVKDNNNPTFVKVSMDGAPYLRKVDLKMYNSYQDLSDALGIMFSSFTIGKCEPHGMKDFMNESKLNGSEYLPTYEDKDGDWMLVGDVPWEMFVDSCKRLRIMKGSDAIGLAPRAVEKCKNRS